MMTSRRLFWRAGSRRGVGTLRRKAPAAAASPSGSRPEDEAAPPLPINPFGIPLLPPRLRDALFSRPERRLDPEQVAAARRDLDKFNLAQEDASSSSEADARKTPTLPELPPLYGDVESHFARIADDQIRPYLDLLQALSAAPPLPPPESWQFAAGWTRYAPGEAPRPVPAPLEPAFTLDVEVCVRDGHHPTLATARTDKAWYSWCSPHLLQDSRPSPDRPLSPADLIPLCDGDDTRPRLVIGHNVSYDRARCASEYALARTATRFLDTMSLHIVVSGMTSGQRLMWQARAAEAASAATMVQDDFDDDGMQQPMAKVPKWHEETSLNNLNDVYQLYCRGQPLKKAKRDVFVTGTLSDIRADFQALMSYCAGDVSATHDLAKVLFPLFRSRCPHPVTLAGMLEMGSAYLPISDRWQQYIRQCEDIVREMEQETERLLARHAKEACQLMVGERFKEDLWLWDQDWSAPTLKRRKAAETAASARRKSKALSDFEEHSSQDCDELTRLKADFYELLSTSERLYKSQPRAPGYPKWYQDLAVKTGELFPQVKDLTPAKKIVPKLLRLSWMGYPLHRHETEKWGYIVLAKSNDDGAASSTRQMYKLELLDGEQQANSFPTDRLRQALGIGEEREEGESDIFVTEPPDFSGVSAKGKRERKGKVRKPTAEEAEAEDAGLTLDELPGCRFFRLPHKDGKEKNVGNPLGKDFIGKAKEGILSAESGELSNRVLHASKAMSYWRSNQDRIRGQMVVRGGDGDVILPTLVPAGTLTRRAVERTWLTASNAKSDRVGSELKTLVRAPPGYRLVGADVDSQEMWISAVLGDAQYTGEHGSTPLGWMTLQGDKRHGTDLHSMTAKTAGVSRDQAKILNYGRIYGAGVAFARQLLQNFNPGLSDREARQLAVRMYEQTKGEKVYQLSRLGAVCYAAHLHGQGRLRKEDSAAQFVGRSVTKKELSRVVGVKKKMDAYLVKDGEGWRANDRGEMLALELGLDGRFFTDHELFDFLSQLGPVPRRAGDDDIAAWKNHVSAVTQRYRWHGGTESHTFNRLEDVALAWHARTPVLGCRISRALESSVVGQDYLPSRVNWVVQSSAVDYLHLLLAAMRWLIADYDLDARFVISIHDEVRYVVRERDVYKTALALQLANLLVRAMFCSRLGMANLPMGVAFFSSVDVDEVMRKEPGLDCATPSNPQGLRHGYGIGPGQAIDVEQLVAMAGTRLGKGR